MLKYWFNYNTVYRVFQHFQGKMSFLNKNELIIEAFYMSHISVVLPRKGYMSLNSPKELANVNFTQRFV